MVIARSGDCATLTLAEDHANPARGQCPALGLVVPPGGQKSNIKQVMALSSAHSSNRSLHASPTSRVTSGKICDE